jgi:hypothetical protein
MGLMRRTNVNINVMRSDEPSMGSDERTGWTTLGSVEVAVHVFRPSRVITNELKIPPTFYRGADADRVGAARTKKLPR